MNTRGPRAPNEADLIVALNISVRRKIAGVTQEQVGEALGLFYQQIQKYEEGSNRISAGRLWEIAELLGTDVNEFYFGMKRPRKKIAEAA